MDNLWMNLWTTVVQTGLSSMWDRLARAAPAGRVVHMSTYPTGTPVRTYLLHDEDVSDPNNVVPTVVVIVRDEDGQIRTVTCEDHTDAQRFCEASEDTGTHVLLVVEGECDLGMGNASAWVAS